MPYIPAWRVRERLQNTISRNEDTSVSLIPNWIDQVKKADNSTYIRLQITHENQFEALFVMLRSIQGRLHFLQPFYTLDSTRTRSQYTLALLVAVGINAEDHILPFAWALVPSENETWWSWFCKHLSKASYYPFHPETVIISNCNKGL